MKQRKERVMNKQPLVLSTYDIKRLSRLYRQLTKEQRYAYYGVLLKLKECYVSSSGPTKRKVDLFVEQIGGCLGIDEQEAIAYMSRLPGTYALSKQISTIKAGAALNSIIDKTGEIASQPEGEINGENANYMASNLMKKIFNDAGYSDENIMELSANSMFDEYFE